MVNGVRAVSFSIAAFAAVLSVVGLALSAAYYDAGFTSQMYDCLSSSSKTQHSKCQPWYKDFLTVSERANAEASPGIAAMLGFAGPIAFSMSSLSCILFVLSGITNQERQMMSSLVASTAVMFLSCGFGFKALSTNDVTVYRSTSQGSSTVTPSQYYTLNEFMEAYIGLSIFTLFMLVILVITLISSKPKSSDRSSYSGNLSISAEEPFLMSHEM